MDDGYLIRQVLSGNRDAFRLLVVRYQGPLFRFLGGFGLEQAAAEELAQETFLRAFRNLPGYDPAQASFSSWLFTIATKLWLAMDREIAGQLDALEVPDGFADRVMVALDGEQPGTGLDRALGRRWVQLVLANLGLAVAIANIVRFVLGTLVPAAGLGGAR